MSPTNEPIVLELATLPREQMGPFLILGLDKTASQEQVDVHWADRVRWARRNQIKTPLEDINWARDALGDAERRLRADLESLNADTAEGLIAALSRRYGAVGGKVMRQWQPLDDEKPLADYSPTVELPELSAVRATLVIPTQPEEALGGWVWLEQLASSPLDPWSLELPEAN
ncbi:MAG: hypothetical protein SNJ82_13620 [Gemmataceae bacterium]